MSALPPRRVESHSGLEQEDACEFQDGGETVDTAGVSVLSMHPSQTLCRPALHGTHRNILTHCQVIHTQTHPRVTHVYTKVRCSFLPYSSKLPP